MITNIIFIVLFVLIIIIIACIIEQNRRKNNISFKEAMELVELPILTVYKDNIKLNLIVDTGCDVSCLSPLGASLCNMQGNYNGNKQVAADGVSVNVDSGTLIFKLKETSYKDTFNIREGLDEAFAIVKEETGVQIHGLLGSNFLNTHDFVIDYKDHIFYKK